MTMRKSDFIELRGEGAWRKHLVRKKELEDTVEYRKRKRLVSRIKSYAIQHNLDRWEVQWLVDMYGEGYIRDQALPLTSRLMDEGYTREQAAGIFWYLRKGWYRGEKFDMDWCMCSGGKLCAVHHLDMLRVQFGTDK